jgi:hypothetical protein
MHKCKHFKIQELVCPETYRLRGERAWRHFSKEILQTADQLKEFALSYSPGAKVYINTWDLSKQAIKRAGEIRTESGLRMPFHKHYTDFSCHSFAAAIDPKIFAADGTDITNLIRQRIKETKFKAFPYVQGFEDFPGMTWLHLDVGNRGREPGDPLIYGKLKRKARNVV